MALKDRMSGSIAISVGSSIVGVLLLAGTFFVLIWSLANSRFRYPPSGNCRVDVSFYSSFQIYILTFVPQYWSRIDPLFCQLRGKFLTFREE